MTTSEAVKSAVLQAKAALKAGHAERACEILGHVEALGRHDSKFMATLGAAHCMAGRMTEGIDALRKSVALEPTPRSCFNLGKALDMIGDENGARSAWEQALELDPSYEKAEKALEELNTDHLDHILGVDASTPPPAVNDPLNPWGSPSAG